MLDEWLKLGHLHISFVETIGTARLNVKVESLEHLSLHCKNFIFLVSIVSYIYKVFDYRWVDFFILASNEHSCNSDKLELLSVDLLYFKVSINQVDCQE